MQRTNKVDNVIEEKLNEFFASVFTKKMWEEGHSL